MPNPAHFIEQYLHRHVLAGAGEERLPAWASSTLWTLGGLLVGFLLTIGWPRALPDEGWLGLQLMLPALAALAGWLLGRVLHLHRALQARSEQADLSHQLWAGWGQSQAQCLEDISLDGRLLAVSETGRYALDMSDFETIGRRDWVACWDRSSVRGARANFDQAREGNLSRFTGMRPGSGRRQSWWEVLLIPIRQGGRITSIVALSRDVTDLRQAAAKLKQMNEEHGALLESLQDGFYRLDNDCRFVQINSKAEELLRQPRSTLLGQTLWEAFPEAVSSELHDALHDVLELRIPRRLEMYFAPYDAWFRINAYPLPGGVNVFVNDISSDVERLNASQTAETRLRLTQEVGGFADWKFDLARRELILSEQARALLGTLEAEPVVDQQQLLRTMHPEDRLGFVAAMLDLADGNLTMAVVVRLKLDPSVHSWRSFRFAGMVIYPQGRPSGVLVGCIQDVTEQHQREMQLIADADFLRRILDAAPQAMCVLDSHTKIVVSNAAWALQTEAGSYQDLIPPAANLADANDSYLEFCRFKANSGSAAAQQMVEGIEALVEDIGGAFSFYYPVHAHADMPCFKVSVHPLDGADQNLLVTHERVLDTTARQRGPDQVLEVLAR